MSTVSVPKCNSHIRRVRFRTPACHTVQCTNHGCQVPQATTFLTLSQASERNFVAINIPTPKNFTLRLDFWKICAPLVWSVICSFYHSFYMKPIVQSRKWLWLPSQYIKSLHNFFTGFNVVKHRRKLKTGNALIT
jgi:hypothetical protein